MEQTLHVRYVRDGHVPGFYYSDWCMQLDAMLSHAFEYAYMRVLAEEMRDVVAAYRDIRTCLRDAISRRGSAVTHLHAFVDAIEATEEYRDDTDRFVIDVMTSLESESGLVEADRAVMHALVHVPLSNNVPLLLGPELFYYDLVGFFYSRFDLSGLTYDVLFEELPLDDCRVVYETLEFIDAHPFMYDEICMLHASECGDDPRAFVSMHGAVCDRANVFVRNDPTRTIVTMWHRRQLLARIVGHSSDSDVMSE